MSLKSTIISFILLFTAFILLFIFNNLNFLNYTFYEWGDMALQGIDTERVKNLEIFIGTTSSQGSFRQPGPFLAYWLFFVDTLFRFFKYEFSVFSHVTGYVILNIFFQLSTLFIFYKNLKNKIFILPISLFFFCFLNTVIEGQFASPRVMSLSISSFIFFLTMLSDFLTNRSKTIIPLIIFGYVVLSNIHVIYFVLSSLILITFFIYIYLNYQNYKDYYLNGYVITSSLIILVIGFFPILYDQFFLTGNLSKIFFYGSNSPYTNDVPRYLLFIAYIPKAFQFLGMFFNDMFIVNSEKMNLIVNKNYLLSPFLTVIFWIIYIPLNYFLLKQDDNKIFHTKLLILINVVIIFSLFFVTGKTSAGKIFELEYTSRHLLSFVFLFYISLIFYFDYSIFKMNKLKNIKIFLFSLFFIFLCFSMPQTRFFLDEHKGYFQIPPLSVSSEVEIYLNDISFNNKIIHIYTDTDDWPLLASLLYQLTRNNNYIFIDNDRYTNMFKIKNIKLSNNFDIVLKIMKHENGCNNKVLVKRKGFNLCY